MRNFFILKSYTCDIYERWIKTVCGCFNRRINEKTYQIAFLREWKF